MAPKKSTVPPSSKKASKQSAKRLRPTPSSNPVLANEQDRLDSLTYSVRVILGRLVKLRKLGGDPCLDIFAFP